jgi:glutaredoxin
MCKRETQPKIFADIEETPGWMSRSVTVLLVIGFLVSIALTVWWSMDPQKFPFRALISPATGFQERGTRHITPLAELETRAETAAAARDGGGKPEGEAAIRDEPSSGKPDEALPESDSPAEGAGTEMDEEQRARAEALRNVSVIMYVSRYSPVCTEARTYLLRTGVSFEEKDVDTDEEARKRLEEINPAGSLPTFEIDGTVLIGFGAANFEDAIAAALEREGKPNRRTPKKD